jgi:hypothetical protein
MAAFLFTVCNIVLVVMDGFSDANIFRQEVDLVEVHATMIYYRFLQTAEMLKPQTPQPHDSPNEGYSEIYPHIGSYCASLFLKRFDGSLPFQYLW